MKRAVVLGLLAVLAAGSAVTAFAATRTVETSVALEVELWVDTDSSSAFVSTRQLGSEWITHDFRVPLRPYPETSNLLVSDRVSFTLPVTVEVEVDGATPGVLPFTPLEPATPHLVPGEAPSGRATCCSVRGMSDQRSTQRAVVAEMREVIAYAKTNFGLTHEGPITINISHTPGGLLVRYRDAFGVQLEELPDACSFQRGKHMFFAPQCRSDPEVLAREWLLRAVQSRYIPTRWVGIATFEYYWAWYQEGRPPTVRDDRYRSAIFHQPATSFRQGRAHEDLMAAAALYAIESYGTFEEWLGFYDDVRGGAEVHAAFEVAFGVSMLRFQSEFEVWAARERTNLLSLAYGSCREAARYLVPRLSRDGGGFPDFRVPLEYDEDGDGYVCEGYALFADDDLVCLVAGEQQALEDGN